MKLTCVILDDEQAAINVLANYIERTPYLELSATFQNPFEALEKMAIDSPDILFLDIHMPQLSGLDFIKLVKGKTKVILTTAYNQYALEGYELDAVDYLLKPIPFDRFLRAVQKVRDYATPHNNQSPPPVNQALAAAPTSAPLPVPDHVFVKVDGKLMKVRFDEILYIEGLGNYVSIYLLNSKLVTLSTMKEMEENLPDSSFMRIHRSYIIAIDKVEFVEGNQVFFNPKMAVVLGETYRDRFFAFIEQKMLHKK